MSDRPQTRQQLYDRIRAASKDEVILEEMIRFGFWPESGSVPDDPRDEITRIGELQRLVRSLATEASRLQNADAMKKEARRRRMAAARERRVETKRKREEVRKARARAWRQRQQTEISWLGPGVSSVLGQRDGQVQGALPDVHSAAAIADAMCIDVGELRFLSFHRRVSSVTHYQRFQIPKKTGGTRLISAPMPRLKRAQRWVLEHVLSGVELHEAAHGFVPGRSIVTNAQLHVGRAVVINLDLKDFFPTLTYSRVFGVFRSLGYAPEAATIFALLCTEPEVDEVELDGRRWFVHASERHLPQGSPCSPAITNIVCRRLDRRLTGLARHLGFTYTRYADDLTFSHPSGDANVGRLLKAVRDIVADEHFTVHPDKTRVMRRGRRQEVTGLVVNDRLGVPRRLLKQWRATLFQVRRDGPDTKRFGQSGDVFAGLMGFAAFVHMVDEARGKRMLGDVAEVAAQHGWEPRKRVVYERTVPQWEARRAERAQSREAADAPAPEPPPAEEPAPHSASDESKPKWWEFWKWLK